MNTIRQSKWLKTIAVSVVIFTALATFKVLQIRSAIAFAESFPEHSESVESSYSQTLSYTPSMLVLGNVRAPLQVSLFSEIPGRIMKVGFTSGQHVEKGQLLIQQDISEESALLDAAKARKELAESIYRRNKDLYASKAVSKEQLDTAKVELAATNAEIARLQSVIRKKTVTAPFSGKAGIHQFEEGLYLQDNVLVTELVAAQESLWVDFHVPQFYPLMNKGETVELQLLRNELGQQSESWLPAKIIARSSQLNEQNRSYQYRAEFSSAELSTAINSGVNVRIPIANSRDYTTVPATAIQQDDLGQFVYLLNKDEKTGAYRAERQKITLLEKKSGVAYIKEGLEADKLVANDGAFKLYPGILVHSKPTDKPLKISSTSKGIADETGDDNSGATL